jgi:hypothetical protein
VYLFLETWGINLVLKSAREKKGKGTKSNCISKRGHGQICYKRNTIVLQSVS